MTRFTRVTNYFFRKLKVLFIHISFQTLEGIITTAMGRPANDSVRLGSRFLKMLFINLSPIIIAFRGSTIHTMRLEQKKRHVIVVKLYNTWRVFYLSDV